MSHSGDTKNPDTNSTQNQDASAKSLLLQALEIAKQASRTIAASSDPQARATDEEIERIRTSLGKDVTDECRAGGLLTSDQHIDYSLFREAGGGIWWVPGVHQKGSVKIVRLEDFNRQRTG